MDTKKAIDFLEGLKSPHLKWLKKHNDNIDKIIILFKRGEKFEKMWESLEKVLLPSTLRRKIYPAIEYRKEMEFIKQKYFPKEK